MIDHVLLVPCKKGRSLRYSTRIHCKIPFLQGTRKKWQFYVVTLYNTCSISSTLFISRPITSSRINNYYGSDVLLFYPTMFGNVQQCDAIRLEQFLR